MKKEQSFKIKDLANPVIMKRVIDTILDPKNPDSNKVRKEIVKNIANIIQKDDAFLTTLKGLIIDKAEAVTSQVVSQTIEESKEYLTNALVNTINFQAQDYFAEKRRIVDNALKKTLNDCVKDILIDAKKLMDKNSKKLKPLENMSKTVAVQVPLECKEEAENYIQFLTSKKQ